MAQRIIAKSFCVYFHLSLAPHMIANRWVNKFAASIYVNNIISQVERKRKLERWENIEITSFRPRASYSLKRHFNVNISCFVCNIFLHFIRKRKRKLSTRRKLFLVGEFFINFPYELVPCVSWRLNFTALKWEDLEFLPSSKVARTSSTINYSHLITVTHDEQEMVWRTFPFCCAKPFKAPTKWNSIVGNPSQSEIPAKVGAHKRKSSYWIYAELSGRKVTESIFPI